MRFKNYCLAMFVSFLFVGAGPVRAQVVRDILGFDENTAVSSNHSHPATPAPPICGDTKSAFLGELKDRSPDQSKVPYEWAPVVANSGYPRTPTIDPPQFYAAGYVGKFDRGKMDIKFSHPFGFVDHSIDIWLDPVFLDLNYIRPQSGNNWPLHVELESGLWPVDAFGFVPEDADRVAVMGTWIMDCGHPENWGAELHPPSFIAFARKNGNQTFSHAFAVPYRHTQLYTRDPLKAVDLQNYKRFSEAKPFPAALNDALHSMAADLVNDTRLTMHGLIEPIDFSAVSWWVCAPTDVGTNHPFYFSYHYTMRSGVAIQAFPRPDMGCVQFIADTGPLYQAMPLARNDYAWQWSDIDAEASAAAGSGINVRNIIKNQVFSGTDIVFNNHLDTPPLIDSYPDQMPLDPSSEGAASLTVSDHQPFPFYGWAKVGWRFLPTPYLGAINREGLKVSKTPLRLSQIAIATAVELLDAQPDSLNLDVTNPGTITIRNDGLPLVLKPVQLLGKDSTQFTLKSNSCPSGATFAHAATCTVTISALPARRVGVRQTTVLFTYQGGALSIPVSASGLIQ